MLKIQNRTDLQKLIADEIQESLTLEYKSSPSLAKDSRSRDELCKDVSAFANSAGGQIIYGITESDHKPTAIDDGSELSREWIEQVVNSNVQPRIEGLTITPITLDPGQHAYVITIPQASGRGAHQAPDHKYYKRQNFQSVPMEDYEVKDVMRRAFTPVLDVDMAFMNTGSPTQAALRIRGERCDPIYLQFMVSNLSSKPADYAILTAYVDTAFAIADASNFRQRITSVVRFDTACHAISANLGLPTSPPLFREYSEVAGWFSVSLLANKVGTHLVLGCDIATPGFIRRKLWIARTLNTLLYLEKGEDRAVD